MDGPPRRVVLTSGAGVPTPPRQAPRRTPGRQAGAEEEGGEGEGLVDEEALRRQSTPDPAVTSAVTTLRNYRAQHMKDYNIMVEYKMLKTGAPGGVYLMPAFDDLRLYYGVVFIEWGLYREAVFKFRLELPRQYPADGALPKLTFSSRVFHPYVHPSTGELNLASKFNPWVAGVNHLNSVLKYLKSVFYLTNYAVPDATNIQAAQLFQRSHNSFLSRVDRCVSASLQRKFRNEPESTIKFSEYSSDHDVITDGILGKDRRRHRGSSVLSPQGRLAEKENDSAQE